MTIIIEPVFAWKLFFLKALGTSDTSGAHGKFLNSWIQIKQWPLTKNLNYCAVFIMASSFNNPVGSNETKDKEIMVKLPDMFHSFLKDPLVLNPHYEKIRKESEQWISR